MCILLIFYQWFSAESLEEKDVSETSNEPPDGDGRKQSSGEHKFKEYICGEEALRISPAEPYCLRRPIRRGHLNISLSYPTQQVLYVPWGVQFLNALSMLKSQHFFKHTIYL